MIDLGTFLSGRKQSNTRGYFHTIELFRYTDLEIIFGVELELAYHGSTLRQPNLVGEVGGVGLVRPPEDGEALITRLQR